MTTKKKLYDKIDRTYKSCHTDEQRLNALRYAELVGKTLDQEKYLDPYLQIEFAERRTRGCFACHHSKRGELRGKVRSYCQPMEDEIIKQNYPDETKETCRWFVPKWKKK